jgi:hypothetical protein
MAKFLVNIDATGNEVQNFAIQNATSAPTAIATKEGGIYYDSAVGQKVLKYYDGTAWQTITSGASGTFQPYDADLTAIAALTGTSGFLKTNGAGTWTVDTNTYLTSATGVVSVNGSSGVITGIAVTGTGLSQFASTSSSDLAGIMSDETGSGALVFGTSPNFTTSVTTGSTTFALLNTTATTINFGGAATAINMGASGGTVTIAGDLVVNGTTTTISSTTITVDDKNIELGSVASPNDSTADGGGITILGGTSGDKTWTYDKSMMTGAWSSNQNINLVSGKALLINGVQVLSASEYTGNAATTTTATNVTGGAAGSLVYQSGSATTTTLGIGTSGYVLTSSGSAPQWSKKKHSETLSTSSTSYAITHGLGTADVVVAVYAVSTGEVVYADIVNTSTTTTLTFATAPSANAYRVVILA